MSAGFELFRARRFFNLVGRKELNFDIFGTVELKNDDSEIVQWIYIRESSREDGEAFRGKLKSYLRGH